MTLRDLLEIASNNPAGPLAWFTLPPLTAALALVMGRGEGSQSPWKWLYSALVYMACVPGVFSVALSIYHFLFEKMSIYQADVFVQILPVVSMVLTLWLIKKNVPFAQIPGFDKISTLITTIMLVIVIMFVVDRTRIIAFTYVPIQALLLIFFALILGIRFGVKRLFA